VESGCPCPVCLSYEELLRDADSLSRLDVETLRIDSPGQNATVTRALIVRGGGPEQPPIAFGEIAFLKQYHRGFCDVLQMIAERGMACLNSPQDISVMFDKWACHRRFIAAGVARPPSELAPFEFAALRQQMCARRNGRLFLKPLHGSSASGVCALRWSPVRQQLIAPLRIQSEHGKAVLVNSRAICAYSSFEEIELILGILLPQGMISEGWIPKLTLPGGAIDLRVLVIAGEARHRVVRQSRHPMTNLHLGSERGDEAALRELVGPKKLAEALELAEKAAACFPDSLYAGVDILIESRHQAFVGEIHAFGDLLPGLMQRGESSWTAIARACDFRVTHRELCR